MLTSRKRRKTLSQLIETSKQNLLKNGQTKTVKELSSLDTLIKCIRISSSKFKTVSETIYDVLSNTSKNFDELNANKVQKCIREINGIYTSNTTEYDRPLEESETKIVECESAMRKLEADIANIKLNMDECLGEDKIKWLSLNRQKKNKETLLVSLKQKYNAFVNNNQSLVAAKEINLANEDANFIEAQSNILDIDSLKELKTNSNEVFEKTEKQNEELSSLIFGTSDVTSMDDEYNLALEVAIRDKNILSSSSKQASGKKIVK